MNKAEAFILANLVEVEGMKVENALRALRGESPMYGEAAFNAIADHIRQLADGLG